MGPLRTLFRALTRTVMRGIVRSMGERMVASAVARSSAGAGLEGAGARAIAGEVDTVLDDIAAQLDIMELIEFGADIFSIMENAKTAGANASVQVFQDLYDQFNRGQQSLAQYCMEFAEEYWETTSSPDPSEYFDGMYSQHEGIEQALSTAVQMSYEAGRTASAHSMWTDISISIGTELVSRGITMDDFRRLDDNWQGLATEIRLEQDAMEDAIAAGNVPRNVRWRYHNGEIETMIIDAAPGAIGATRQLSWDQFMGSNQPYWFTERQRMYGAVLAGQLDYSDYQAKTAELYRATHRNPFSTSAPPGYSPYSGPTYTDVYGVA